MLPKLPAGHFLGHTLNTRALSGFRLTETTYASGLRLPRHAHELAKYCFVLAGSFVETIGLRRHLRQPLTIAFQPADTTHEEAHEAVGQHFLIELDTRWLERAREYSAILDQPVDLQGGLPLRLATQLYDEFRRLDNVAPLAMEGLILELLVATSRRATGNTERRPPRWLQQLEELLRVRFAENLSLQELAAAVNVHEVHLARVFRKFHGCTVGDFLRQLRIEYASRQLSMTEEALANIAAAAGFADQSHFSRTFKSYTGMLPTEFRAIFRAR
jgi:AraC family transcriptional regulator